ncbi:MAG: RNA polymerase factor sigma-54 [Succinivibrionaceae bacterium]|nr:RNA polymerase factor sigma-54 [Succinivibrionaceae bacterium]
MSNTLQIRAQQTLAMTPQLQQAIRLLQLSSIELQQELRLAVDRNPLLDLDDSDQSSSQMESLDELRDREQQGEDYNPFDNDSSVNMTDITMQNALPTGEGNEPRREEEQRPESPLDDQKYAGVGSKGMAVGNDSVYEGETSESLQDHLMWQLNLSPLEGLDRLLAERIIDGIDDSGYLSADLGEIIAPLRTEYPDLTAALEGDEQGTTLLEEAAAVLKLIQHYDPRGVGSRSVREYLLLQLRDLPAGTAHRDLALKAVEQHFSLLASHDFRSLCSKLSVTEDTLRDISLLIKSLRPRPAEGVVREKSDFVIPDVIAYRRRDGSYGVELNPDALPKVRLNSQYQQLANRASNERDRQFFKDNLQEANWLLQSLGMRNETLLRVSQCIVDHQRDFLERGPTFMHPMVLHDVAEEVERHESTISRVTTEKYIYTPRGTFELKYFFSSSVGTDSGGTASSTAIRSRIKEIISTENLRRPFSDSHIADMLKEEGILVARRTVTKYRESLGIASSSQRKQLV